MRYRKLGQSDIEVSVIAMGCWAIVGDSTWGTQDRQEAIGAIRSALDHGINFFDTAEAYGDGESERLLGEGLGPDRDRAIIASKVSSDHLRPDQIAQACERSLQNLNTDRIDLYQVHWASREAPLEESLAALESLRSQGKIRAIGVCNFGPHDLDDLLASPRSVVSNQLVYSLLARAIEYEIQPRCVQNSVSILPYSPLAQGLLTGKFRSADEVPPGRARTRHFSRDRSGTRHGEAGCEAETFAAIAALREIAREAGCSMADISLAWLLHQPGVTSVLAGARSPRQIEENVAASDLQLSPAVLERLSEVTGPVKRALGPNADMWQNEANSRIS